MFCSRSFFGRIAFIALLAFAAVGSAQTVWYVDDDATGANDGTSWADAFTSLQSAIAAAQSGYKIFVASGTYMPTSDTDRTKSFVLKSDVAIYGGFAGNEDPVTFDLSNRDFKANETILTGDIGTPGDASDNSYHVVIGANNATLDGFTITGGNANASSGSNRYGGGIYGNSSSLTMANIIITGNMASVQGGGICFYNSSPTITNSLITANSATGDHDTISGGGGLYFYNSSPTITNTSISGNNTGFLGGGMIIDGGMLINGGNTTLIDCVINNNVAASGGGGICCFGNATLTNCDFNGNVSGESGGGMRSANDTVTLTNCRFNGNTAKWGGGYKDYAPAVSILVNCLFDNNTGINEGGGISSSGEISMNNCTFIKNKAYKGGGLILVCEHEPSITNCLFVANKADQYAGAIRICQGNRPTLTNCTFAGNSASLGIGRTLTCEDTYGSLPAVPCVVTMTNCILWNEGNEITLYGNSTTTINYSNVFGGWPGMGNINANPLFVAKPSPGPDGQWATADDYPGDLRLLPGSPCIDAGDNAAVPEDVTTDLLGVSRFIDDPDTADTGAGTPPIVDMGAYEYDLQGQNYRRRYVNANAAGANNGKSWTDAYNSLQDALAEAQWAGGGITELWVAAGTYKPDRGANRTLGDRAASFNLVSVVAVYGGFAGNETSLDQRDPTANVTVLSGDVGTEGNNGDNSYHVLVGSGTDATAILDGFTVTGGNANGAAVPFNQGGGMYVNGGSPTLNHCVFIANAATQNGAGLYLDTSSPRITNTQFLNNTGLNIGGAIYNRYNGALTLINCLLAGNTAKQGAAVSNAAGSGATLINCTVSQNTATTTYGGIQNAASGKLTATNCVFWENRDSTGTGQSAQIYGGTLAVSYSCVQDADPNDATIIAGTGNIDDDPLLATGIYTLASGSPCIDAGDNAAVPGDILVDLLGEQRIADGNGDGSAVVDMGVYEYVYEEPPFILLSAVSRKTHGKYGDFDLVLPLDHAEAAIEPRNGGPTMIVLTFSEDIEPATSCANIILSGGACQNVSVNGSELAVTLSGVAQNACLSLTLDGLASASAKPLTGDADVHVRVILGEANGLVPVNILDLSTVKAQLFQPVTADNFRADVYPDGAIDVRDLSATKSNLSKTAMCE